MSVIVICDLCKQPVSLVHRVSLKRKRWAYDGFSPVRLSSKFDAHTYCIEKLFAEKDKE